jgi:CubicO group peptidase (beta-lactamase class C family)
VEARTPITDSTLLFNVASISKVLTAFGVVRLVERGAVDLDAPIEKYLTRWRLPPSGLDHSGVTVRRVLSHTAGLSAGAWEGYGPDVELPTLEDVLAGTAPGREALRVAERPGGSDRYSNGGFGLLQLLVEEVTGRPFAEYMRAEVLLPLGMSASAFGDPAQPEIAGRLATPHDWRLEPIFARRFSNLGAGGLFATLDDMGRLAAAELYEPASGRVDGPTVSPASLRAMHRPVAPSNRFGLGHVIQAAGDLRVVGHTGLVIGGNASLQVVPETGDAIVVLTNGDNGYYVHHTLVYIWSLWTTGQRLGSGDVAPKKRVNRLVGVLERASEAGRVKGAAASRLVALLEEVSRAIDAGERDKALTAVDRISTAAADLASRELSVEDAAGLARHVEAVRGWLRLP